MMDLFGGYVQEGMLTNVGSWKKRQAERDDLSNPQGDIVRREIKLPLLFGKVLGTTVKITSGIPYHWTKYQYKFPLPLCMPPIATTDNPHLPFLSCLILSFCPMFGSCRLCQIYSFQNIRLLTCMEIPQPCCNYNIYPAPLDLVSYFGPDTRLTGVRPCY